MVTDSFQNVERKIAESLFGKENLKSSHILASNPLVLFCKDRKNEQFKGDLLNGFDFRFCNTTKTVQTDVGICVTSNPTQYVNDGHIHRSDESDFNHFNGGLRESEHVMIIQSDKYMKKENLDFSVSKIIESKHPKIS